MTNKPTKDDLIEAVKIYLPEYMPLPGITCPGKKIKDALISLIENRPEVDEEFVERWVGQIFFLPLNAMESWSECLPKQLREMLREAGVMVRE